MIKWMKRRKLFKKKLAYMMWEYENETKPRIDALEKHTKMKIYSLDENGKLKIKNI